MEALLRDKALLEESAHTLAELLSREGNIYSLEIAPLLQRDLGNGLGQPVSIEQRKIENVHEIEKVERIDQMQDIDDINQLEGHPNSNLDCDLKEIQFKYDILQRE